ncbi:hypothetical protein [Actinoplanes sp. NPDC026619]|uniref:hypothetical protein n=1 Tax=Actinoplanes sp. NPDC026619 TaxID=3155798 RepID=UPI003401A195
MTDQHVEERPSWDCRACGNPWPCPTARAELATTLAPTALRTNMWMRLEVAALDMPGGPAADLFERFLRWTG